MFVSLINDVNYMKKLSLQLLVVIFSMIASLILFSLMSGKSFEPVDFSIFATIGTVIGFALISARYSQSSSSGSIFPQYSMLTPILQALAIRVPPP
jgi:hypothetical protein